MKYYTPSLDEFHVGFECEVLDNGEWKRCVLGFRKSRTAALRGMIHSTTGSFSKSVNLDNESKMTDIRVKYLDQDDFISLGFEVVGFSPAHVIFQGAECIITFYFSSEETKIEKERVEHLETVFYGKILNKNILRKVLQQVGISYYEQENPTIYEAKSYQQVY